MVLFYRYIIRFIETMYYYIVTGIIVCYYTFLNIYYLKIDNNGLKILRRARLKFQSTNKFSMKNLKIICLSTNYRYDRTSEQYVCNCIQLCIGLFLKPFRDEVSTRKTYRFYFRVHYGQFIIVWLKRNVLIRTTCASAGPPTREQIFLFINYIYIYLNVDI